MMKHIVLLMLVAGPVFAWEIDQHEAIAGEWGYRPAAGTVADVNPPAFTWRPEKNGVVYSLEVAKDAGFTDTVYTCSEMPWSAHCPYVPFPAGVYYWRYRGKNVEGEYSDWSTVRTFTIPEGLVTFPMPNREELERRIPDSHPRLFFKREDITQLKELAAGSLASQWQQLVDRADALLKNPPDTSEPPLYQKDMERKGEEWKKVWWGNRVRAVKLTDAAATLAFVYRLSGDEQYGQAARALMMAFCEWDPKGSTNYNYNDEAAMPLLYYPSRTYTWAYDVFTDEERDRIRSVMKIRGEDCFNHLRFRHHLWHPYASHSNRAWHWLGEVATAFYDEIPETPEWLSYSMTIFYTCYPVWGGVDGGWHEGQAYWVSYLRRFMYWALVLDSIYDINAFDKPFFKKAGDFGLYTCPPGTKSGAFGDQVVNCGSRNIASFMGLMGAVSCNPYWKWFAEQHGDVNPGGYFGFLVAAQGRNIEARSPDELPSSKVFRDVGIAALNTNLSDGMKNIQVHFKSSPYGTQSHGYNANNAFLVNIDGLRALIRSGKRDIYGSPHHKEWMWHTKSDNAILVNGEGQLRHSHEAIGAITHFFTSDTLDVVAGEAGASYENLNRWCRRVLFFKPGVVVIHDILDAKEAAQFQWLLHAQAPFELAEDKVALQIENVGRIDVRFLTPETLTFSQKDTFDTPPHEWAFKLNEWHFTAETQEPKETMAFITLLRINNADATATMEKSEGSTVVTLTMADTTAHIYLNESLFSVEAGELSEKFVDNP